MIFYCEHLCAIIMVRTWGLPEEDRKTMDRRGWVDLRYGAFDERSLTVNIAHHSAFEKHTLGTVEHTSSSHTLESWSTASQAQAQPGEFIKVVSPCLRIKVRKGQGM